MAKKFYQIEETLTRFIVVDVDDDDMWDAETAIDEACGGGFINLDSEDFAGRRITCLGDASDYQVENNQNYKYNEGVIE